MTIGERIKELRGNLGMSQTELAAACKVSRAAVTQWESGQTKGLRPENLITAADKLQTTPRWLVTGKHKPSDLWKDLDQAALDVGARYARLRPKQRDLLIGVLGSFEEMEKASRTKRKSNRGSDGEETSKRKRRETSGGT